MNLLKDFVSPDGFKSQWKLYLIAFSVFLLDIFSKALASESLHLHERLEILPVFDLTLRHNYGAAFSFLADQGGWQVWFFGILTTVVSVALIIWIARLPKTKLLEAVGLSLVLGGALGNLYDRVTLGYVVDFILVYYKQWEYPAFNIADSAICIGVGLLVLDQVLEIRRSKRGKNDALQ